MVGQRERVHFLTGQLYRSVVGEEGLEKIVDDLIDAIGASAPPAQTDLTHPADLWSQHDVALTPTVTRSWMGARNHSRCCVTFARRG